MPSDSMLSLAFSLHSTPGSHALLLGAGISAPAGVPSAWGVQMKLIERLATASGATPSDLEEWYFNEFGEEPTYGRVIQRLAPSRHDRQALLKSFFEPSEQEREEGRKIPTLAHRAIARLVSEGAIRVIVTTNFDRLTEAALRDIGIEPVVVAGPSDITGLAPLHTIRALVVHLHGDYLTPAAMLNTDEELDGYDVHTGELLDEILRDYGLAIIGWSGTYDSALRDAIARTPRRIYPTYWIDPAELSETARDLAASRSAIPIRAGADAALGLLADAVTALSGRELRHPLSLTEAVDSAKRALAGRTVAIGLHDRFSSEFDRLRNIPELNLIDYEDDAIYGGFDAHVRRIEDAELIPVALTATLAMWGSPATDPWWSAELERSAQRARGYGSASLLDIGKTVGTALFRAGAIGAVLGRRHDLLSQMLAREVTDRQRNRVGRLETELSPELTYASLRLPSERVFNLLEPIFATELAVGRARFEDAWERVEFLCLVSRLVHHEQARARFDQLAVRTRKVAEVQAELDRAQSIHDVNAEEAASDQLRQAYENQSRKLGALADLVDLHAFHIRVENTDGSYYPVTGRDLRAELRRDGPFHPLLVADFANLPQETLADAVDAVNVAFHRAAGRIALSTRVGNAGSAATYFWLDTQEVLNS